MGHNPNNDKFNDDDASHTESWKNEWNRMLPLKGAASPTFGDQPATITNTDLSNIITNINSLQNNVGVGVVPIGGIIMWSGDVIPSGWRLCDGKNGSPNLIDKFIVSAGGAYVIGAVGGQDNFTIQNINLPQHKHGVGTLQPNANNDAFIKMGFDDNNVNEQIGNGIRLKNYSSPDWTGTTSGGLKWDLSISGETDNGGGVSTPSSIDNRPSFYALAYIQRIL